eukprot:3496082-Rhodomonas_salina.1
MDFKFNFGAADTPAEPAEKGPTDLSTPEGFIVPRRVTVDWQADMPDEETLEALYEEMEFKGREPILRCRPPNSESLDGPLAAAIEGSDLVPG